MTNTSLKYNVKNLFLKIASDKLNINLENNEHWRYPNIYKFKPRCSIYQIVKGEIINFLKEIWVTVFTYTGLGKDNRTQRH